MPAMSVCHRVCCRWLAVLLALPAVAAPELPVVRDLGVVFGRWDSASGKAGDFVFSSKYRYDTTGKALVPFGERVVNELTGPGGKVNNSLMYYLPAGVAVRSMIAGVVQRIEQNTGATSDQEIHISPGADYGEWLLIIDHVANPVVTVGQRVAAGEEIAETSGKQLEYTIHRQFLPLRSGAVGADYCPQVFFDPTLKDSLLQALSDLQSDWERYAGDSSLYQESSQAYPGCDSASLASDNVNADRVFDWAEVSYPQLLAPAGGVSATAQGYYYRYYAATGNYVGLKDGEIWFSDGNAPVDVGSLADYLAQAFRAGY